MRSFLLKNKVPTVKWKYIPNNVYFKGKIPEGYQLAVSPSDNYIIIDVDRHGKIDGFENIPMCIQLELDSTFNYPTKNNGKHYWLQYTGKRILANKTSGKGFDLRTNKGYVVWYPEKNVLDCLKDINTTSETMNKWLEKHFSYIHEE